MSVNMPLKIHLLHKHVDFFKDNLGQMSDEHGERFHQQIKHENMLAECVWNSFEEDMSRRHTEAQRYVRTEQPFRMPRTSNIFY